MPHRPTLPVFLGAVLGHAVGDALGAPVEFLSRRSILGRYPPDGIVGFEPWTTEDGRRMPAGSWTDDTQLMLATAVGLLRSLQRERRRGDADPVPLVYERYREWLVTQDIPGQRRYPGTTCLAALGSGEAGSTFEPLNDRKGSGGLMRVTPVGLAYEPERAFEAGAEIAAITHGHPSGYLAAGFFADVVSRVARGEPIGEAIAATREVLVGWDESDEVLAKVDEAVELFIVDADLDTAYEHLGEGWVAEEALGIALCTALNFPHDFAQGVLCAVNITGDSDTTGALTGALLGAMQTVGAVPAEWTLVLEEGALLERIARDLYDGYVLDEPLDEVTYPPD